MKSTTSYLSLLPFLLFSIAVWGQPHDGIKQKLAALANLPDGEKKVTILVGLAYDYLQFNADSARWYAEESFRLSRKIGDAWGQSAYYIWQATVLRNQGEPDSALVYLDSAHRIADSIQDMVMLAGIYQTKANIFEYKHEGMKALVWMEKAEQYAAKTKKGQLKANIQHDKARIYQLLGEMENAMSALLKSAHLADSMGRDDILAAAYEGLGSLFIYTEDEPKLRENAEKGLALAEKIGNPFLKAQALYKMGIAEALKENYAAAKQRLEASLELHQNIRRQDDEVQVKMTLARVLVRLKQYEAAQALLHSINPTFFGGRTELIHEFRSAQAFLLEETGHPVQAESWYKQNVEIAEKSEDRRAINKSYTDLSRFYERQKNYPAALAALRSAKQILSESNYAISMRKAVEKEIAVQNEKDKALREKQVALLESDKLRSELLLEQQQKALLQTRLQTEQQQRALTALEAQQLLQSCEIESKDISLREAQLIREKKEGEVALLNQEKTLQSAQLRAERLYRALLAALFAAALAAVYLYYRRRQRNRLLELRTHLAQDLHDDLGSDMSGISLASFSAARSGDTARMREALQTIAGQSSRLVEDMRDIVWSIHPDNDSLEKIAARMRQYTTQMLETQGVNVYFKVAANALPLKMQPEARKHLYLFFKEAIHNIAQHAHCSEAHIGIQRENGAFVLEIRDNGQGFDTQTPPPSSGGNGLRNLHNRAAILGGNLTLESRHGEGTVLRLVAPLA